MFIILLLSACGGGSTGSSGASQTGSSTAAASGIDVVQFTVSGATSQTRTLTVHPADVNSMTFTGGYDLTTNKVFTFFIDPSGQDGNADSFLLSISPFTGPGSYTLQWNAQTKLEDLDVGLAFQGGVDWSLKDSPGKTCQATVSSASAQTVAGNTLEEVQGTFSCPELDALALFGVKPIQVTNGSFTVFVQPV